MTKTHAIRLLLPAFALAILTGASGAAAEQITFRVKSMAEQRAQIQFFSKDRHHRWPSVDRAYNLDDYNEHEFTLNCIRDEKICYGAWPRGSRSYWGVGPDGKEACSNCCYTCRGNDTQLIILRNTVRR